jgi:transposase
MRTPGSPIVLEYRRRLAVQRVHEGYSIEEVADFRGVVPSSVRRWVAAFRQQGVKGLAARPVPERPPKLNSTQEKIVCRWLTDNPIEHGCATDRLSGIPPSL